ncbi:MAG: aromatic ring-hydroxylating dioxygenase subunit alpha [Halieaceae bacterium]|nr:aromatic ring-hydroxylating dioxygenase subunit alpha [Halieaceae bacterium]
MGVSASALQLVQVDQQRKSFRIHRSAFKSGEVFEREKEQIFSRCWLYLGHRSEIPNRGDFVCRSLMGRNLIFQHTRKGEVIAFYNACTHRGAAVCWDKRGSKKTFTCRYHGWVFDTEGKLKSMNAESGYPEDINDDGHLNLPRVRLEQYGGLYFINFSDQTIPLYDYLGDYMRGVIDAINDQSASGEMIITPGEHAYSINANYKLLIENSADGYHLMPVHRTYLEFLADRFAGSKDADVAGTMKGFSAIGGAKAVGNGHYVLESNVPTGRPVASWIEPWGSVLKEEIDATRARLEQKYGKERMEYICELQKNIVVFPNLVINDILATTIRTVEPTSPGTMQVTAWCLAPVEESAAMRAIRLDNFVSFLGPAGFGSPDDGSMLNSAQKSMSGSPTEWTELSKDLQDVDDLRVAAGPPDGETHMQGYWTQWDMMLRGAETLEG